MNYQHPGPCLDPSLALPASPLDALSIRLSFRILYSGHNAIQKHTVEKLKRLEQRQSKKKYRHYLTEIPNVVSIGCRGGCFATGDAQRGCYQRRDDSEQVYHCRRDKLREAEGEDDWREKDCLQESPHVFGCALWFCCLFFFLSPEVYALTGDNLECLLQHRHQWTK